MSFHMKNRHARRGLQAAVASLFAVFASVAHADWGGLNMHEGVTILSRKIRKQAKKLGVTYEFLLMRSSGDQLRQITTLIDQGVVRPVVGKVVGFDETPQALQSLSLGGIRGKAVMGKN
jgi:NADPH:quinone reductase-like Zn-dependent oxidoreductase